MDCFNRSSSLIAAVDPSALLQMEQICDEIENNLREGQRVDIERMMHRVAENMRPALFRELMHLQLIYHPSDQQPHLILEMRQTFPEFVHIVEEFQRDVHVGHKIGNYTLKHRVGEGGMGEVWVAVQTEPVKRQVALKLVRRGLDSHSVLQRFEHERQALALMDHPHIARVYDGGITASRQPYFVMELVHGLPLSRYCDDARLTLRQRLELFVLICHAVQHAHHKGIVHRDLKPANILVSKVDGKPSPKIIDFGVAKAISGKLTDQTMSTQVGSIVGTLEYMSPEQAGLTTEDIDTRADIYSMGVILFELLTGLRPIDSKRLNGAAIDEIIRMIKEEEVPSLSSRLSSDVSLQTVAASRQIDPAKLITLVKGELDWIVHKCLEKNRNRRYDTASGLARDIERFLQDEPVEARPVSTSYRINKFIRRHRVQFTAICLVLLALVGGIIGTSYGLVQARSAAKSEHDARLEADEERFRAEQARAKEAERAVAEENAKKDAQTNLAQAMSSNDILTSIFTGIDPDMHFETVADLVGILKTNLLKASNTLQTSNIDNPIELANMQYKLGISFANLGEHQDAILVYHKAIDALMKRDRKLEHKIMYYLAFSLEKTGKLVQAEHLLQELSEHDQISLNDDIAGYSRRKTLLADIFVTNGKYDNAILLLEDLMRQRAELNLPKDRDDVVLRQVLASACMEADSHAKALQLYTNAVQLSEQLYGSTHQLTLQGIVSLANCYRFHGKINDAIDLLQKALIQQEKKFKTNHEDIIHSKTMLARAYVDSSQYMKAVELSEDALQSTIKKFGEHHRRTIDCMNLLARCYSKISRNDKAIPLFEAVLKLIKNDANYGSKHPNTFVFMGNLAHAYLADGQFSKAIALFEETHRLSKNNLPENHKYVLLSMYHLARAHKVSKNLSLAIPLMEEARRLMTIKYTPRHNEVLECTSNLADSYRLARMPNKALPLFQEVYLHEKSHYTDENHPKILDALNNLALGYEAIKQYDKALPLFEELVCRTKVSLKSNHPELHLCISSWASCLESAGQLTKALPLHEEAACGVDERHFKHPYVIPIVQKAIWAFEKAKHYDKAAFWQSKYLAYVKLQKGANSSQYYDQLSILCRQRLLSKNWTESESAFRELLAIRLISQPDAWTTFNTQSMLGGVLLKMKKYPESETLLLAGYEGMKKREKSMNADNRARLADALDRLIQLYCEIGNPDKMKHWQSEKEKSSIPITANE